MENGNERRVEGLGMASFAKQREILFCACAWSRESGPGAGMEPVAVDAAFFGGRGRGGALKNSAEGDPEPEPFATMLSRTRTRMRHLSTASSRP